MTDEISPAVVAAAWAFVRDRAALPADTLPPPIVYDSDLLMRAAHGRPGALSAYWQGEVIFPTNGYSDEVSGPLLAHEFTHHAQHLLGLVMSAGDLEAQAYAAQAAFKAQMNA